MHNISRLIFLLLCYINYVLSQQLANQEQPGLPSRRNDHEGISAPFSTGSMMNIPQSFLTFSTLPPYSLLQPVDQDNIRKVDDVSLETADFIRNLEHSQLVAFLQIMLVQRKVSAMGSTMVPDQGRSGGTLAGNATEKTPLSEIYTIFESDPGQSVLKTADNLANSKLGKYIAGIHEYWKKSSLAARNMYRSKLLSDIDSLNVPLAFQHAVQEILPGLVTGN